MPIGQDFYPNNGMQDIENLSRAQAPQALFYGDQAARYADPFMGERTNQIARLHNLQTNPGSITSDPAYQFMYDQGLNALQRKGSVHSGNKLAQLMQYGQGLASQYYMPLLQNASTLAMSGSSPASAGLSYARGAERSQDYNQMAAAARGAQQPGGQGQTSGGFNPNLNAFGQPFGQAQPFNPSGGPGGWGGGGYGMPTGGYYSPSTYQPTSGAGTGYMSSDYGTTQFGGSQYGGMGGNWDMSNDPYASTGGGFGQYDAFSDPYWNQSSTGLNTSAGDQGDPYQWELS